MNSPAGVPIYQFKSVIVVAGVLLAVQGLAQLFRCILAMRDGVWLEAAEDVEETEALLMKQMTAASDHPDMK